VAKSIPGISAAISNGASKEISAYRTSAAAAYNGGISGASASSGDNDGNENGSGGDKRGTRKLRCAARRLAWHRRSGSWRAAGGVAYSALAAALSITASRHMFNRAQQ